MIKFIKLSALEKHFFMMIRNDCWVQRYEEFELFLQIEDLKFFCFANLDLKNTKN